MPVIRKKIQPDDCIACEASGKSSRGGVCIPCNGTGKKRNESQTESFEKARAKIKASPRTKAQEVKPKEIVPEVKVRLEFGRVAKTTGIKKASAKKR